MGLIGEELNQTHGALGIATVVAGTIVIFCLRRPLEYLEELYHV